MMNNNIIFFQKMELTILKQPGIIETVCSHLDWKEIKVLFWEIKNPPPFPIVDKDQRVTYTIGFNNDIEKLRKNILRYGSIWVYNKYKSKNKLKIFEMTDFKIPEDWLLILNEPDLWFHDTNFDKFCCLILKVSQTITFSSQTININKDIYYKLGVLSFQDGDLMIKPQINPKLLNRLFPSLRWMNLKDFTMIEMAQLRTLKQNRYK